MNVNEQTKADKKRMKSCHPKGTIVRQAGSKAANKIAAKFIDKEGD